MYLFEEKNKQKIFYFVQLNDFEPNFNTDTFSSMLSDKKNILHTRKKIEIKKSMNFISMKMLELVIKWIYYKFIRSKVIDTVYDFSFVL